MGVWGAQQGGSPPMTTAVAEPGTVKEKVAEPATLDDVSQADVNSDVSGDVGSLDVSSGDYVYADETLATTDSNSADASLYDESLVLNQDEAQLASDRSDQTLQSAEAQVAADELAVSTDQAAATQTQDALATLQAQEQATLQQDEPAVAQAEQTLAADTVALTTAQSTAGHDQVALETAQEQLAAAGCPKPPSGSTTDCTTLAGAVTQAQTVGHGRCRDREQRSGSGRDRPAIGPRRSEHPLDRRTQRPVVDDPGHSEVHDRGADALRCRRIAG